MKLTYRPTNDGDPMQIVDDHDVGTLGVRLAPDTADLFAAAPELLAERDRLATALETAEREHQDCGMAVVALSRCVREAIDALPPALQRNSAGDDALARWVAVLRQWGIEPRSEKIAGEL